MFACLFCVSQPQCWCSTIIFWVLLVFLGCVSVVIICKLEYYCALYIVLCVAMYYMLISLDTHTMLQITENIRHHQQRMEWIRLFNSESHFF